MKKFYGVGIGPGDKELITLKGLKTIEKSDYIFLPKSRGKSTAASIAGDYIEDKKIIAIDLPMGEDNLDRYRQGAKLIYSTIKDGQQGVFLTLGDPMTYSTYIYLLEEMKKYSIDIETIPGITSYSAAASTIGQALSMKDDSFYLCDGKLDSEILKRVECVAILKTSKDKRKNVEALERAGFNYTYIKRCTREDQEIVEDREAILSDRDYMSLIIGRKSR